MYTAQQLKGRFFKVSEGKKTSLQFVPITKEAVALSKVLGLAAWRKVACAV
jgi:hypothetical protein